MFQRFWRKLVSKILKEVSFKVFIRNLFKRFWRKLVSNILEEICFKYVGGKWFQRFGRKIVSKILEENSFKNFEGKDFEDFFYFFVVDKSCNLSKVVSVLLSASIERFFVSRRRDSFNMIKFLQKLYLPIKSNLYFFFF